MKWFFVTLLLFSVETFAQDLIAPGTILPAQLNSPLNSRKGKPGQRVTARVMQDIPVSQARAIRAGSRVEGEVISVRPAHGGANAQITLKFDRLHFAHQSVRVSTTLRALASMLEVEDAEVPPSGPDRGTPWAWTTRNLIGGDVAYGEGGPVVHGSRVVGHALVDGVLVQPEANPSSGCGEVSGNAHPQAMWVFSADACGVYGVSAVRISHRGATDPLGQITLTSSGGEINIRRGSGVLLQVNSTAY